MSPGRWRVGPIPPGITLLLPDASQLWVSTDTGRSDAPAVFLPTTKPLLLLPLALPLQLLFFTLHRRLNPCPVPLLALLNALRTLLLRLALERLAFLVVCRDAERPLQPRHLNLLGRCHRVRVGRPASRTEQRGRGGELLTQRGDRFLDRALLESDQCQR